MDGTAGHRRSCPTRLLRSGAYKEAPEEDPTDTDTIRRRNPRHQGDIGVAAAIAHFMANGYRVAIPLGESQPWDLIIEEEDGDRGPERVQVKTTTFKSPYGVYVVGIATNGGNQSWNGVARRFDPSLVEWLFVLTDALERYLIPSSVVTSETTVSLGARMAPYRLDQTQLRLPL